MCGIAGEINTRGEVVSRRTMIAMTERIAHRGPDGDGCWTEGSIALGHRRLAIIDLTDAARQPMESRDGRYVLTYNGEVYNYREIRQQLEHAGCTFRSTSDTEVVLNALHHWGVDAVKRFNGMFAFALWDRRESRLLLARDRYGIKPLYYTWASGSLLFASEAKAFFAHPAFERGMDMEALVEYMTFQNFFGDRTLLKGVRILPAGCVATIAIQSGDTPTLSIERYWDFDFREPTERTSDTEYIEEFNRLFAQAVDRQLVSDVEVGSFLSGGLDSGAISAVAARHTPYLKTFTVGFDLRSASGVELAFDEREKSEHMSYLFRTEHYEMVLKAGDMERILPLMCWHLDEPRVGQSYPNFYAAKLASRFCKVVLAGTGGDELFGGYPWRYYRAVVNDDFEHYVDKYYEFWQRILPAQHLRSVFRPVWNQVSHVSGRDIFRSVFQSHAAELTRPEDYVNHSMYLEAKTFLHGLLLVDDKLSMAHGLETRVPFLDNDLVDFAMRLPVSLKLGNLAGVVGLNENEPGLKIARYFEKTHDGKLLLRRALSAYVPDSVVAGVKQGFSAPDASWFRGESIDYVRRVVHDDNARIYGVFDRTAIRNLVDEHLDGRQNRRLLIWSLLNINQWMEHYL